MFSPRPADLEEAVPTYTIEAGDGELSLGMATKHNPSFEDDEMQHAEREEESPTLPPYVPPTRPAIAVTTKPRPHRHSQRPIRIRSESQNPFGNARTPERLGSGVASTRVTKTCGHQYCDLTQPRCCSCMDMRPIASRYSMYVDGRGVVADPNRWTNYCPGCKVWHGGRTFYRRY
jgi:hypothetical protein